MRSFENPRRPGRWATFAVLALGVCTFGPGLSTYSLAGTNLIRNGDFEQPAGKFPGVGQSWETNDGGGHPDVDALTTTAHHGGKRSQWLKANSQWDLGAVRQVSPYGSAKAGRTYYIQAWIKTANVRNPAGWYVFGVWCFKGDQRIGESKMPRPPDNNYDWRCVSWTAVAPPGADRLAAVLTRHTDGDAWYDDIFIGEVGDGPPTMARLPASLNRRVASNGSLPDDVLAVQNTGGSVMKYTVETSARWLSVVPRGGSSAGNIDECSIRYHLAGLAPGQYAATATVACPGATNSPQKVAIGLIVDRPSAASRPTTSAPAR